MLPDNSNLSLIKRLTIIIPTYQRQKFMIRSMHYWSGKGAKVIFLDGSEIGLNRDILSHMKPNVVYIHSPVGVYERVFSSISLVDTEYVMFGCDDEFYILSALNSCLTRLSLDSKFVACTGRAIGFNWYDNSAIGYNVYPKLNGLILDNPDPANRLIKHFSNYVPAHIYAVCRTSIWKIAAQMAYSKEYNFFAASELQMEFLLVYAGKTLVIPELMWMRSGECTPHYSKGIGITPFLTFSKWWISEKSKKEKEDFIVQMNLACIKINKLTNEKNFPNIKFILEAHHKSKKIIFLIESFRYLPTPIRHVIKFFFKLIGHDVTKRTSLMDVARLLEATGVKVNFDELELVEKIISSFYEK